MRAPARKQRDPSAGPTAASANAGTTRAGGSAPGSAAGTPGTRQTRRGNPMPELREGNGRGGRLPPANRRLTAPQSFAKRPSLLENLALCSGGPAGEQPVTPNPGERSGLRESGPAEKVALLCRTAGTRLGRGAQRSAGGRFKSEEGAGQQSTEEARTEAVLSPESNFARAMRGTATAWQARAGGESSRPPLRPRSREPPGTRARLP